MRKFKYSISIGYANAVRTGEIELPDDMTEEEIEQAILDCVYERVDWSYEEIEQEAQQ